MVPTRLARRYLPVPLLSTCRESREELLQDYPECFQNATYPSSRPFRFNYALDIAHIHCPDHSKWNTRRISHTLFTDTDLKGIQNMAIDCAEKRILELRDDHPRRPFEECWDEETGRMRMKSDLPKFTSLRHITLIQIKDQVHRLPRDYSYRQYRNLMVPTRCNMVLSDIVPGGEEAEVWESREMLRAYKYKLVNIMCTQKAYPEWKAPTMERKWLMKELDD